MGKKNKKVEPQHIPSKRQLSKWQRQAKIRKFILIGAAVFLAGITGYISHGYYNDNIKPLKQTVIEVNDASFTMEYYVNTLEIYIRNSQPDQVYYMANMAANQIIQDELIRQGASALGIDISHQEVAERIKENNLPDEDIYQDMVTASLLRENLQQYFASQLPDKMEQVHAQVMLVESQKVADDVISKIESGGNFTALLDEFSCYHITEGDLGWLPQEFMPSSLIGDAVFSTDSGKVSKIEDGPIMKNIGYWLIEITDKDEEKGIKPRAMLLGSKQEADEIKDQLNDDNFAELSDEHSQYNGGEDGGELGWLKQGDMNSEAFDEVAFTLPLAEISEPVKDKSAQTSGGYWIINVLERGEHDIEDIEERLINNEFLEWSTEQEESSTINNYLNEEEKLWAINRITKVASG